MPFIQGPCRGSSEEIVLFSNQQLDWNLSVIKCGVVAIEERTGVRIVRNCKAAPGSNRRKQIAGGKRTVGGHKTTAGLAAGIDPFGIHRVAARYIGHHGPDEGQAVEGFPVLVPIPQPNTPETALADLVNICCGEYCNEAAFLSHKAHIRDIKEGLAVSTAAMEHTDQGNGLTLPHDTLGHIFIPFAFHSVYHHGVVVRTVFQRISEIAQNLVAIASCRRAAPTYSQTRESRP